ncbi:transcriptional regulator family: C2H2 zinc finger [Penicillium chermesinum]|uniref:Transcriptional regulator family: C2H2 zinc finger n=1 Tax=Penicillium chermesinum TaxID=63820 RepID=A0A9W9P978_9EURO|nr:transcriptional regulator family: C2H2 zinc finger [Penicillium chermesinum]KAJ5240137.1 transcriptional regulator family: C2H2 zinc finger [Penicillium chermesinum]
MASFLPVNNSAATEDHAMDGATTPRANRNGVAAPSTRSGMADQRPEGAKTGRGDGSSRASVSGHTRTSSNSDETMHDSDENEGSENEGDPGSAPPSKKKKGQRFFCTDFPPCNLSFTRSEHLARHIRKHTGERPFQCHCSRRFSRLDNLRQHAQTVHVNEEIPGDSLAATGTRFQRQVRTDRVRPPGRARAGTAGSVGGHSRGHSRNLSTSSITSTASTYSQPPELRRRPPPLIMANDPTGRARMGFEPMGEPPSTPPGQIRGVPGPAVGSSPYTPTTGFWEGKTAARRLSVPTGSNPFIPQHGAPYPPYGASPAAPYPNAAGVFASPTSNNYPPSRDESAASAAEADIRRRTWHPSTYPNFSRPTTSGLNQYHTPDTVRPSFGHSKNHSIDQPPRLPGIESFDKVVPQQRPLTPPTRKTSPMQIDGHNRPPPATPAFGAGFNYTQSSVRPAPPISGPGHRRGHVSWDMSLHTNLTGLDIRDRSSRDTSQWREQTIAALQGTSSRPSSSYQPTFGPTAERSPEEHRENRGHAPSLSTGSRPNHTSPEDSSSSEGVHTPSTASVEYHPAIVHSSGYIESHDSSLPTDHPQPICGRQDSHSDGYPGHPEQEPRTTVFTDSSAEDTGMGRLEALVAVATSENKGGCKIIPVNCIYDPTWATYTPSPFTFHTAPCFEEHGTLPILYLLTPSI